MKKRGQISFEYIIVFTFAMLILIPGMYLLRTYAFESQDTIAQREAREIGNELLLKAQKMNYYGPPSKSTLAVQMPNLIERMYIAYDNNDYIIGFKLTGSSGSYYVEIETDIPIEPGQTIIPCDNIEICSNPGINCECFPDIFTNQGLKELSVKAASNQCTGTSPCIIIDMIGGP